MSRSTLAIVLALAFAILFGRGYAQQSNSKKFTADDYVQIEQLYTNYALAMDMSEGERLAALFVEDGEFTNGRAAGRAAETRKPSTGREELRRAGQVGTRLGLYFRHFTTNIVITPTAEGAKGSCYLLLFNAKTAPATLTETAIYDDTLVKTAQGWKFKKRVVWRADDDITPFKAKPLPPQAR
jgi:3-phenylpropionate/cinnamic acid dioxygenase small subunit